MLEKFFLEQYGVDVKLEFETKEKENNQDISTIIAEAFDKFVEKEIS